MQFKRRKKMKYCTFCGTPCDDGQRFCTCCGAQLYTGGQQNNPPAGREPENQNTYTAPKENFYQPPYEQNQHTQEDWGGYRQPYYYAPPANPNRGIAIASLVLGICSIAGIAYCGLVTAVIGMILGIKAMSGYQKNEPGRGIAVAGFVCSVVAIAFSAVIVFVFIGEALTELIYHVPYM